MDSSCIDAYLTRLWLDTKDVARVVYLPTRFQSVLAQEGGPNDAFAKCLQDFIGLNDNKNRDRWKEQAYAMVIHEYERQHYFVAVFDFAVQCVNVYGRFYSRAFHFNGWRDYVEVDKEKGLQWICGDRWGGQVIYRNLKHILLNEQTTAVPPCETVNWHQVWFVISELLIADDLQSWGRTEETVQPGVLV